MHFASQRHHGQAERSFQIRIVRNYGQQVRQRAAKTLLHAPDGHQF